ncbi:DMT family transporter [Snodgrassella sp. CFCC 13594]|uniref:DMT family transporter n=1 Tax=Snodgrassella sp. CFCC 13594 TaxID=1775559 RepID=UPI0008349C40|nr:DMT family transporter [Snodgrassella sp. CFCC 13594]
MTSSKVSGVSRAASLPAALGSAWMIGAAFFFALMGGLVKKAGQDFGYGFYELVFWRTIFGVISLGLLAKLKGYTFKTRYLSAHISRGFAGTLGLVLFFYGLTHLSLATATTLNYTSALFLALLSVFVLKEHISRQMILALLLGFVGIMVLLRPTFAAGEEISGVIGLGSGLCAGWAYLQVRELSQLGEPSWRVVFYFSLVATITSAILSQVGGWHPVTGRSLVYLLSLGITATLGQICLTLAYQYGRKFVAASLSYLTVVFATLLGVVWLDDVIHWQEILGMGIIVGSGILSSIPVHKK